MNAVLKRLMLRTLRANVLALRDVKRGEDPFLYSSGHKGPGYLMVKGLVSQDALLRALIHHLAVKALEEFPDVEFVAGNVTGGLIPGWIIHEALSILTGEDVPFVYVRDTRKVGGHSEQITGDKQNEFFDTPRRGLTIEELVNFAQTTTNSVLVQRKAGHDVRHAATILDYGHEHSRSLLQENGIRLISLFTLSEYLDIADESNLPGHLVADYRAFLTDPVGWQKENGFEVPVEE